MQSIRELITKWGFEVDEKPLDKIEHSLEQIKGRLEFISATEVIKGIFDLTERFANFAEELHIAAVSAGVTVEAFEKLAFAAGQSAVSQDEMAMSMARLSRMVYQARQGSEQATMAFNRVGFSGEQVANFKSGSDAMMALADRFKDIHDPIEKQALAMQLMGRGSVNMVGFLSQGSAAIRGMGNEAEKLGAIITKKQVDALIKLEHAMKEIYAVFQAVGATIASYLAPEVEAVIHDFLKFYEANRKIIDSNIKAWVYDVSFAFGYIYEIVKVLTQKFFDFAKSHDDLIKFGIKLGTGLSILGFTLLGLGGFLKILFGAFSLIRWILGPVTFLFGLLFSPIGMIVLGIIALVTIIHDLWVVLTGGAWESTWLYKAFQAAKGFGAKALNFFGFGEEKSPGKSMMSSGLSSIESLLGFGTPTSTPGGAGMTQNYSVNAPMTINVPAGTDHKKVIQAVKEGVADHLDRQNRRTQQSFTPAVVY